MEQILHNLVIGFGVAVTPIHLLYALIGCLLGTLIGVLPGIGPVATIAMLLPITFNLSPVAALIMLAGIYYGAQYGGSTTAILVNIPGESSSVVTCLDGYQMARQGRAGPALAVAALGSFFAGCVATLLIAVAAPPLAEVALKFGPAEYFTLMLFAMTAVASLTGNSPAKGMLSALLGLMIATEGIGRSSSTSVESIARTTGKRPIKSPSATPRTAAMANPCAQLDSVESRFVVRSPLAA